MPPPEEDHLLYVLLDSNLPTGGFVASSGLESYAKHGFFTAAHTYETATAFGTGNGPVGSKTAPTRAMMEFAQAEVQNYASTTLCFVNDTWRAVHQAVNDTSASAVEDGEAFKAVVDIVVKLDQYHEATMLSHVARRSSKAQGVAMLTLYSRGLSFPAGFDTAEDNPTPSGHEDRGEEGEISLRRRAGDGIVERYKRMVRAGKSPGHLAVSWGIITAALGLSLDRALHLHLFLHARSLLSSAVRLNIIGPYASSQLLLHPMRGLIEEVLGNMELSSTCVSVPKAGMSGDRGFWDWAEVDDGPHTTWPLGEVLTARHDLQHSRIFNS